MKIGIISPLFYKLPPETYGGTEAVVYALAEGLVKNGHQVTVYACKGSRISGHIDTKWGEQLFADNFGEKEKKYLNDRLNYIISQSSRFDIIHNNDGILPIMSENDFKAPMVSTWHITTDAKQIVSEPSWVKALRKTNLVSISDDQRKGLADANYVATVYNGTVDLNKYLFGSGGDYLAWIGRFGEDKGAKEAVNVAEKSGRNIVLGGAIRSERQQKYFDEYIKNKVDNKKVKYLGEVNLKQKVSLLQNAHAFLMPIHWEEPFGLVMIEAMACGTPVLAFNRGSVPELIENGKNGFIVKENDIEGMVSAVDKVNSIDRKYCRETVEKKFSIEQMVSGYENVYKKVISDYKIKSKE